MDTEAVRSFVRAAELGQLQHAADELGVTQQAVSKRVAALERELRVQLFTRTARGVELTPDGRAFLAHARSIVAEVDRAVGAVRPGARALRIDVLGLRSAQAVVLHEYWRAHPGVRLDVVTLRVNDPRVAAAAVQSGEVDASFRSLPDASSLPPGVRMVHAFDSALELLVGPNHPLAPCDSVTPAQLRGHRIWIPGITPQAEWSHFYDLLGTEFGLAIDAAGPHFGDEVLLDSLASSADVATLVGARDRYTWSDDQALRRIPVVDPTLAYPVSLLVGASPHPALRPLLAHLAALPALPGSVWCPQWTPSVVGQK